MFAYLYGMLNCQLLLYTGEYLADEKKLDCGSSLLNTFLLGPLTELLLVEAGILFLAVNFTVQKTRYNM